MSKVWYVTGASKGLGLALVKTLLAAGHKVAATSRNKEQLLSNVGITASDAFLPLSVDLTDEWQIEASIATTHDHFGGLDVIVNNAGYGIGGAIEELNYKEIKDSFDINVMATALVIHHAMPYLRAQRSGHIINIASIAGVAGTTGWSAYSAAKAAVIGLTEGLAQDVKEFGIHATVIAPGAFRTDFLTRESLVLAAKKIEAYTGIHTNIQKYDAMNGNQAGDPAKAAKVMMDLADMDEPPVLLFLGKDAYQRALTKVNLQKDNLEKYNHISASTDF